MADDDDEIATPLLADLYKPPALLPIAQLKDALLYTIETYPVTIIVGETGSGKTTQIPQFLYRGGWTNDGTQIAVTQPRRIAATSVATRVAEEMNTLLGQEVGYSIRFEDVTSEKTKIKFLTDGLLLREMLVDPLLKRYSVIMVDEAHERSLSSDILLALLKKVLRKRRDLRVVVSSATIEAQKFLDFFAPDEEADDVDDKDEKEGEEEVKLEKQEDYGKIISISGRPHPVEIQYLDSPTHNYVETAVETVINIHTSEAPGDILLFLTGREEIDNAIDLLADHIADLDPSQRSLQSLPLYAGLPQDQQMYVFQSAPPGTRRVIVSTNIAEASVTIDGIVYVVDSGYVKLRAYDPNLGIERLNIVPVSKASATQRAGRAGRTRPGKCFRLYGPETFEELEEQTFPEICRSNLAPVILQIMNLGIQNIIRFDYLAAPPSKLIVRALDLLSSLGAISSAAKLTKPLGNRMAELPLEPMVAKALLNAQQFNCVSEMITISAMLTLQGNVFITHSESQKHTDKARRKFAANEGDHITLFNVYQAFVGPGKKDAQWCRQNSLNFKSLSKAVSVRKQLRNYLDKMGVQEVSGGMIAGGIDLAERVRRCLTTGFFAHAAKMSDDGTFKTVSGDTTLWVHPSSMFFHRKAEWVIYHEILETRGKIYIRDLTSIQMDWLMEYAPDYYRIKQR